MAFPVAQKDADERGVAGYYRRSIVVILCGHYNGGQLFCHDTSNLLIHSVGRSHDAVS